MRVASVGDWIPAFAGMTGVVAGMMGVVAGMRGAGCEGRAGLKPVPAGRLLGWGGYFPRQGGRDITALESVLLSQSWQGDNLESVEECC